MKIILLIILCISLIFIMGFVSVVFAQGGQTIDPEAIIEQILSVEKKQQTEIKDIVFDAEYIEGERDDNKEFKEKEKFIKKVYIKYFEDTAWYHEEYLEYYKEGELQDNDKRDNKAEEKKEKKLKRKNRDISFSMLEPFMADNRGNYIISYMGVVDDQEDNIVCHYFRVAAKEENETFINGDYYFEAESFHLLRVNFSPAKLVKKAMFKLKDMNMSILYSPTPEGFWLPRQFDIEGNGKAMFFIGVKFSGTEYYRNPVINAGIPEEIFEVTDGQ